MKRDDFHSHEICGAQIAEVINLHYIIRCYKPWPSKIRCRAAETRNQIKVWRSQPNSPLITLLPDQSGAREGFAAGRTQIAGMALHQAIVYSPFARMAPGIVAALQAEVVDR